MADTIEVNPANDDNVPEELDFSKQIQEIKTLQIQSTQNRKELATKTQSFKSLTDDELKLKKFMKLLKQYQREIDSLTKRCTVSEEFVMKLSEQKEADKDTESSRREKAAREKDNDDLLSKELELKEERISQLLIRNDELMNELKKTKTKKTEIDSESDNTARLNQLEFENIQLINKLDKQEQANRTINNKVSSLTKSLEVLHGENKKLNESLSKVKDYDTIKTELNTLRLISFGENDDGSKTNSFDDSDSEDEEDEDVLVVDKTNKSDNQLDEILISRNKKLNDELVKYRSTQEGFQSQIRELESKLNESTINIERLTKDKTDLEEELNQIDSTISNHNNKFDTMSIASNYTRKTGTGVSGSRRLSPASSIAGGVIPEEGDSGTHASSSVLPIITSQRDRFRSRNIELEAQIKKQLVTINELKLEISKLKKTNTELFERTRYLASFQKGTVNRFNDSNNGNADPESQIESSYEESLHPLTKFRQHEQQRIASKLSPLERIFLSFAKAILANKTSRLLFLMYCFGLHCLIMLMSIYVMSLQGTLTPEVGKVDKTVTMIN